MLKLRHEADDSADHFQVYSGTVRVGTIYRAHHMPGGDRGPHRLCRGASVESGIREAIRLYGITQPWQQERLAARRVR